MKLRKFRRCTLLLTAATLAVSSQAFAANTSLTWDGGNGTGATGADVGGTWNTVPLNWSNGSSNVAWVSSSTVDAIFGAGTDGAEGSYAINIAGYFNSGAAIFNNSGYVLNSVFSQALNIGSDGSLINPSTSVADTTSIFITSGKTADIGGKLSAYCTGGTGVIGGGGTLNVTSGAALLINTGVSLAVHAGSTLNIQSGGTLSVTGGGVFYLGNGSGTPGNNDTLNVSGGTINLSSLRVGRNATGCSFTISSGTVTAGSLVLYNTGATSSVAPATATLSGGTVNTGSVTSAATGTGNAAGATILNFNGGTLQASAASTNFIAVTTANVQAGGAIIDSNGFNLTIGQSLLHDPALGTAVDGGLTKRGVGTVTLNGTNTYTGPTTITGGTLMANGYLGTGRVTMSGGSSLSLTGTQTLNLTAQANTAVASSVQTTGGSYPASAAFDGSTGTRWSSLSTDPQWIYVDLGATYNLSGVNIDWEAASANSFQIQTASSATNVTANTPNENGTGGTATNGWTTIGNYTSQTPTANTYTPYAVSGSARYLAMYGTTRNVVGGLFYGYSLWEMQATVQANYTIGSLSSSDATTSLSLGMGNLTVGTDNTSTTFAGSISGSGSLIKTGTGTQTLTASNTYSGGTIINTGTLAVSADAALGTGAVTINNGSLDCTTGFSTSRSIALGTGTPTIQVDSGTQTLSTSLTGTSLTKAGSGTLILASSNAYTGGTTINAGTLAIGADAALGTGTSLTVNNGTLELTANFPTSRTVTLGTGSPTIQIDSGTQTLLFNGTGSLTKSGAGQLNVASLPSAISVTGGKLQVVADSVNNNTLETLSSLSIPTNGVLDLTNHDLLVKGGLANGLAMANYRGKVTTNTLVDGAPNAPTTIALVSGKDYKTVTGTSTLTNGTTISDTDLCGKFTYMGDANLDGKITADDYLALDVGYLFGLTGWTHGDFEQTGSAPNAQDYADIDLSYQNQAGKTAAAGEIALHTQWFGAAYSDAFSALSTPVAVPEPTTLGLLTVGAMGLLRRKNRR